MKFLKTTALLLALGIIFIGVGIIFKDPRPFSFGLVWLLIASAKSILSTREKAN